MKTAPGRLASPCTLTGRPRPLSVSHLFGPSDHRARAELEPRVGLPPCSPASFPVVTRGEGPVCGPHKRRALKVNRRNYRRSPRRRSPASDDRRAWRGRGAGRSKHGDLGAAWRARRAAQRRFPACPARPHSVWGRPGSRDGRREPCAVRLQRHAAIPSRGVKTGKWGPRTLLRAPSLSWTQAVTQASPRAEKTFGSPYGF